MVESFDFTDTLKITLGDGSFMNVSYLIDASLGDIIIKVVGELDVSEVSNAAWMGFGLSERETGSMKGSDIAVVTILDGHITVSDYHVGWIAFPMTPERSYPQRDAQQDWNVVDSMTSLVCDDVCTFSAVITRKLTTGDLYDRDVEVNGKNRVIVAMGAGGYLSYHGTRTGFASVDFTKILPSLGVEDNISDVIDAKPEFTFNEYTGFNATTTQYACKGFSLEEIIEQGNGTKMDIVAIEPLVALGSQQYVHHFVLHQCLIPPLIEVAGEFESCGSLFEANGAYCNQMVYAWARGGEPLLFPEVAGLRIGKGNTHFALEIHYDNPNHDVFADSSGIRLYMTKSQRQFELGLLQTGDPFVRFPALKASDACSSRSAICPAECTTKALSEPIHVFGVFLHMHARGRQAFSKVNGDIVARLDYWDQGFQEFSPAKYTISPGDVLETVCNYDNSGTDASVPFSFASLEEMCIGFHFYYPNQPAVGAGCGLFATTDGSVVNATICGYEAIAFFQPNITENQFLENEYLTDTTICVESLIDDRGMEPPPQDAPNRAFLGVLLTVVGVILFMLSLILLVYYTIIWRSARRARGHDYVVESKQAEKLLTDTDGILSKS